MHDAVERDVALGRALTDVAGDPMDQPVDWAALKGRIAARAEPELRRRRSGRRSRFVVPAALAAGVALFLMLSRPPSPQPVPDAATASVTELADDLLLDARVSDDEVRAVLSGATEADALLLIAAEERP
jgi:hypothetical protein